MMKIRVRTAKDEDLDSLVRFDHVAQRDAHRVEFIGRGIAAGDCAVAEMGDEVAGFVIMAHRFFGNDFIDLVYVAADHRRLGVGSALVAHAETICTTDKLFTSTNLSNKPMQSLLKSRGYALSGYIDNLDEGDPELVYVKRHAATG